MSNYSFILQPYKSNEKTRFNCPNCNNSKSFTRYIYNIDSSYINEKVGKCNRENKCGYHYTPKQYFSDNDIQLERNYILKNKTTNIESEKSISYIDISIIRETLNNYNNNNFISFLLSKFEQSEVIKVIQDYKIGTINNKTVFWQIDENHKIRTGKIILYDEITCKRSKTTNINWIHSFKKIENFNLSQCLFGEHLINDNTKNIHIVESEKTAIICSILMPNYIWLATGSKQNLNQRICSNLKNRNVCLFPDTDAFIEWNKKAEILNFNISDYLQNLVNKEQATEGYDLADILINNQIINENKSVKNIINNQSKNKAYKSIYNFDFDKKTIQSIVYDLNIGVDKKDVSNRYNIIFDEIDYILYPDRLFYTFIKNS